MLRFFRDDKSFDEQWEGFKENVSKTEQSSHDVLIHIPFRNKKNNEDLDTSGILESLGLDICTYEQLIIRYSELEDIGGLLNREKKYFRIEVPAFDIYSSAHKAFSAEKLYRTYDYLDSSGRVFEATRNIFKSDDKLF